MVLVAVSGSDLRLNTWRILRRGLSSMRSFIMSSRAGLGPMIRHDTRCGLLRSGLLRSMSKCGYDPKKKESIFSSAWGVVGQWSSLRPVGVPCSCCAFPFFSWEIFFFFFPTPFVRNRVSHSIPRISCTAAAAAAAVDHTTSALQS